MGMGPGAGWAASPAANAAWGATWNEGYRGGYQKSLPRPPLVIQGSKPPLRGQEVKKVGGFSVGDRVFHQKVGYGTIRVVEDNKLEIAFEKAGDKKVMDAFVERA
jgi:DNA helicase-2/ATP-dependent DNA helicase PcrA